MRRRGELFEQDQHRGIERRRVIYTDVCQTGEPKPDSARIFSMM
jgi:hypothetical protein